MEELRAIESELEKMAERTRARLARGAQDGALAAGGFSSSDSLVMRVSRPGTYLGSLGACLQPSEARAGVSFGDYAALLDELDAHERQAMQLIQSARKKLTLLEAGAFKACGYGSYEELLERVLNRLPMLSTTLLATDPRISRLPGPPDARRPARPAGGGAAAETRGGSAGEVSRETLLPVAASMKPLAPQPAPSSQAPAHARPRGWRTWLLAAGTIAVMAAAVGAARGPISRAFAATGGPAYAALEHRGR